MKARAFARASLLYAVATFIPRIGLFVLLPVYARAMSPSEVGAFSLMMSLVGILAIIYKLGLDATLVRFHFEHERDLGRLYGTVLAVVVASILLLSGAAALALVPLFASLVAGIPFVPIGAVAMGVGAGNALQFIPSAWYRATEQPGRFLGFTAAIFVVSAAVTLYLVMAIGAGVVGALLGQLAGAGIVVVMAMLVVLRLPRPRLDREVAARALRFGLPLLPHAAAAWALNVSDRWLLAWLLPVTPEAARAEVGVYWIGYQLGYAIALVAVSIQAAWLPIVYRQTEPAAGGRVVANMLVVAAAVLSIMAVALTALAPELISIMAGPSYGGAIPVLAVVAASSVCYGLYAVAVPVLLYARRTGTMAAVTLGAGLLNIAINVVAIPSVGIVGAALATLAASAAYATVTIALANRHWPLRTVSPRVPLVAAGTISILLVAAWHGDAIPLWARIVAWAAFAVAAGWLARPALGALASATDVRSTPTPG